jgi:nucleoside-diphosphate-sugar epimerase
MRLLFAGGTGVISSACADLAVARGHELFILARGMSRKHAIPNGAIHLRADLRGDQGAVSGMLAGLRFDAVADFLCFTPEDVEAHLKLLGDKARQFVFISSASAYQKPPASYLVHEGTPLENAYSPYARGKIACEERLVRAYRDSQLPITIVRPSLTYGPSQIPLCVASWSHPWTVVDRIKRGRPLIVPGDGTSLWVLTWNADFARGLLGLLGNPAAIGEAFHITSDEVLTWDQIYRQVFEAVGASPAILHLPSEVIAAYWPHAQASLLGDKIHSVVFDNRKIMSAVPDFRCEVTWADGLRRAINWHESHPEFQTVDHELDVLMDQMTQAYGRSLPG